MELLRYSFHGHEEAWRHFARAYELQMTGQLPEALKAYRQSIKIHPTAEAWTFLGWAYSYLGRLDLAISYCKKAIAVDPDFGNPYNDIGAYLLQLDHPKEAAEWLRKATRAPRYASFHFAFANLGCALEAMNEPYQAISSYKRALQLEPRYTFASRRLIRLLSELN